MLTKLLRPGDTHNTMVIHHYCGTDAFMSILTQKKIWLSSIKRMNDRLEGKVIEEAVAAHFLEPEVVQRVGQEGAPFGGGYGGNLGGDYESASRLLFACSFSAQRDQAVQWMSYAHQGKGFSIGFDEDLLWGRRTEREAICEQEFYGLANVWLDPDSELVLTPVVYYDDAVKSEIMKIIEQYAKAAHENSAPARMGSAAESYLRRFRGVMKDASFRHEGEYRLIYRAADWSLSAQFDRECNINEPVQWRSSVYGMVPYFRFEFDPKAVTEVWIGPGNIDALHGNRTFVEAFLKANGLEHVNVYVSTSAYRG